MLKIFIPRLRDILFIAIFGSVILTGPRLFNLDGDLGRHITIGNYILDQFSIPTQDMFSHTMNGAQLTPHEWLAQVAFALAHRLLGLDGVVILTAFVLALAFTLLYNELLRRGTNPLLAIMLILLAAAASSVHFLARPHIFTILFLAIWTPLVMHLERGEAKHAAYFLPAIMLAWANTHGAYIAGFVVMGTVLIEAIWEWTQKRLPFGPVKQLTLAGLASTLILIINPAGMNLIKTSIGYIQNKYLVSHTQEYLPPDFHNPGFLPFLLLLSVMILCFSRGWKRLSLSESLLAASWTAMSLYSARNIPLFAIVVTPIIASMLNVGAKDIKIFTGVGDRLRDMEAQLHGILWPLASVIVILGLCINGFFGTYNSYNPRIFPVQAMDWLDAHPQHGNMFNYFTWGGYILYRGWPQNLVFIDGQTDFYGEALTREYEQTITAREGWETVFEKYAIEWAILPASAPLTARLHEAGWNVIYEDETAAILRAPR